MKSLKIYRQLLRLYPKPYRDEYADQMAQTLSDMLADRPSKIARANIWLRASLDLPLSITQQNLIYVGDIMVNQAPGYVKRNSLIGVALIVPFFAIIFSRILQNNNLTSSDIVQSSLYLAFLMLPAVAFILTFTTLIKWSKDDKKSFWQRLIDVRHNWMLTTVSVIALGIILLVLFHDSAHCIIQNPIRTVHNPSQTYQCIKSGFLGG